MVVIRIVFIMRLVKISGSQRGARLFSFHNRDVATGIMRMSVTLSKWTYKCNTNLYFTPPDMLKLINTALHIATWVLCRHLKCLLEEG